LPGVKLGVGPGARNIALRRKPQQKVREGVAAERSSVEGEGAEIVGATEALKVGVAHAANVHAELHRVVAVHPRHVVGELERLRTRRTGLVAATGREGGSIVEVVQW